MHMVLLIVGVALVLAGVITFMAIAALGPGSVSGVPGGVDVQTIVSAAQWGVSGLLGGLGALFLLGGMSGLRGAAKRDKLAARLMSEGLDAEGTVTYVDRNFSVLVNQNPIYSIVEYTYRDSSGNEHTRRIENAPSELIIRRQIQVGSRVPIKYARHDPAVSLMVLT